MRKLLKIVFPLCLTGLLSAAAATAAQPQWDNVGLWKKGAFYMDRHSVVREGDFRKLYTALDYREPQQHDSGKTYRSTRSLLHVDCKKQEVRTLHLTLYAGPMMTGQVLEAEGILNEWMPVPQDTPIHRIFWMVC